MKVTLIQAAPPTEKEIEFPVLMEWIGAPEESVGSVVLFLSHKTGITLKCNTKGFAGSEGNIFARYVEYSDKKCWRKYEGKVELTN